MATSGTGLNNYQLGKADASGHGAVTARLRKLLGIRLFGANEGLRLASHPVSHQVHQVL